MPGSHNAIVLDAWAILAWLQGEHAAAAKIQRYFDRRRSGSIDILLNVINLGEVYYIVGRKKGVEKAKAVLRELESIGLDIMPAPRLMVMRVAEVKMKYAVSLADAFAIATAKRYAAPLVTGDPEINAIRKKLQQEDIELIILKRNRV